MLIPEEQSLRVVAMRGQLRGNYAITRGMTGTIRHVKPTVDDRGRSGVHYEVLWDFGISVSPPDPVDEAPEEVTPQIHTDEVTRSVYQTDVLPDDIVIQETYTRRLDEKIESICRYRRDD